jgi:hypothetical protein
MERASPASRTSSPASETASPTSGTVSLTSGATYFHWVNTNQHHEQLLQHQ